MRVINEPEQIAYLEWAACHVSDGVRNLLWNLQPGMTEHDAVALLGWNGTPLSCHLMLTAGPRAKFGLFSPSDRRIARGDTFTTAYGIWGALTCRAGFVVEDAGELPAAIRDYVDRLVVPYFEAVAEWLEALHIGQTGGALNDIIARRLARPVLRHLPQPRPPDLARRVGQLARRARLEDRSCVRAWRSRSTSSRPPALTTSRATSRTASRWPTSRCDATLAERYPQMWRAHRRAPRVHGRRARDRASPGRPAALEPAPGTCRRSSCVPTVP